MNGDCLAEQLAQTNINHDFIVCRECLIDGDVNAGGLADFWSIRAKYIAENFNVPTREYYSKTVREFEKLDKLPDHSEVCLWFENDLFCQANMWFVISILTAHPSLKIFRVFPMIEHKPDIWKGFGIAKPENLQLAYDNKILFTQDDLELGRNLWAAYQNGDLDKLKHLAKTKSGCFQYLEEVCQAHMDRFPTDKSLSRPERVIKEIMETKSREFSIVFTEFTEKEGIFGFGDSQIKKMYDRLIQSYI